MKTLKKYKIIILITIIILLISNCKKIDLNCYNCIQIRTTDEVGYNFNNCATTICGESERDMKTFEKMNTYDLYILKDSNCVLVHFKTTCELNH
jgi:hypothetical protein